MFVICLFYVKVKQSGHTHVDILPDWDTYGGM